jgi:hypothetical protein
MHTGAIPERITADLEALKLRLAALSGGELPADQATALAQQISAIRLQLKRIAFEQAVLHEELERRALEG